MLCPLLIFTEPITLFDPGFLYKLTYIMANSTDSDQLASLDLHCLQSSTRVKTKGQIRLFLKRNSKERRSYTFDLEQTSF